MELGDQTNATALFLFVEQNSGSGLGDHPERKFELLAAVAPEGVEYVAGEALGMDTDQRWLRMDIAHHQGDGRFWPASFGVKFAAFKTKDAESSEFCREIGFGTLRRLNFEWRGAHEFIISAHSC